MALITDVMWRGEPIKAILHLGSSTYTVYSDTRYSTDGNFIKQINFTLNEGNSNVNPLGISTSNSVTIQIYDMNDYLSPDNTKSPFFGKTVNGVKIELFISYDGATWSNYGVYYATSWSGAYSDGLHDLVSINAEDKLNTIGNMDLPELPAYANVEVGTLIADVMAGIGIPESGYSIDSSLNMTMNYGIVRGTKVREFLNNICQLLFARVIIDRDSIIRFIPALETYVESNEIHIGSEYTGTFQNKNNSNINYNKVAVKYLEAGNTSREQIFNDSSQVLAEGFNRITDISFRFRALSIEQINVDYDATEEGAYISSIQYKGFQNGIELGITVENGPINNCVISGEGMVVSTTEKKVEAYISNSTVIGGSTYEFDTQQMLTRSEANTILIKLQNYLSKIGRNVIMSGSALTPKLYTGDKVVIENTGTMYDGTYKVVALSINFGEDYSLSATFIRL